MNIVIKGTFVEKLNKIFSAYLSPTSSGSSITEKKRITGGFDSRSIRASP